jgi:gas vesicle protein
MENKAARLEGRELEARELEAREVAASRRAEARVSAASGLLWFATGLAVGAAAGILFAPKPGDETRRQLADLAADGRTSLIDQGRRLLHHGREIFEQGRDLADEAADLFDRGRQMVDREAS